ncbi:MAG: protein kinase, partial [Deltaproteobacteria bacterium]|nr:protein kinase [Deltaproteobacteria bacterium]
ARARRREAGQRVGRAADRHREGDRLRHRPLRGSAERRDVPGTWPYMAPEALDNAATTARSDQYSWCVCTWETLYGGRPFPANSVEEQRRRCRQEPHAEKPGDVPTAVMPILETGLAVDPERRYVSIDAMLSDLEAVPELVALRKLTPPEERIRQAAERRREQRKLWWAIGGLALGWPLVIVALVLMAWPEREPNEGHEGATQVDEAESKSRRPMHRICGWRSTWRRLGGPSRHGPSFGWPTSCAWSIRSWRWSLPKRSCEWRLRCPNGNEKMHIRQPNKLLDGLGGCWHM